MNEDTINKYFDKLKGIQSVSTTEHTEFNTKNDIKVCEN